MIRPATIVSGLLVGLCSLAPAPASAHEYWLAPSMWRALPGDTVSFGALAGQGFSGERKLFAPARAVRLILRAARDLDLGPVAAAGDSAWARFAPGDRGGLLFAYESNFATITLDAEAFDLYLAAAGLDGPLEPRRRAGGAVPGRERYRRCAKAWLKGDSAARATRPLGLPLEIVPLSAPGVDSTLRVRVLFDGRPLEGAQLRAWRQPLGAGGAPLDPVRRAPVAATWAGRTDGRGEARVPAAEAGEWLIGAVHMVPSRDAPVADWESSWASLTFGRFASRR